MGPLTGVVQDRWIFLLRSGVAGCDFTRTGLEWQRLSGGRCPTQDDVEGVLVSGFGSDGTGVVVGDDVDLLEKDLVEHALEVFGGLLVGVGAVLRELEGFADKALLVGSVGLESSKALVDLSQLFGEAFLLGAQDVQRDGVVVVGFQELLALALDDSLLGGDVFHLLAGLCPESGQLVDETAFEVLAEVAGEMDAFVETEDLILDLVGEG
ncbi:hypothetical protein [Actinomyces sp.]|uniref:hypothetical protein n=1 Tax=Actinomyces sp. TaxID=29317 RepID=UPI00289C8920|nr:hypothetical protein [Actinomyces sp.]